MTAEERH